MTLQSIAAVRSRISQIEGRFPVPAPASDFRAALIQAAPNLAMGGAAVGALPPAGQQWAGALPPAGQQWAGALPPAGQQWASQIQAAAQEAGIDPRLLAALTWAESGFQPGATSSAGAKGLTQLMPGTAAGLGVDASDPAQNLRGGAKYLRAQLDRFGRVDLALAAYNAGPGRVAQAGGVPRIAETQAYVPRVLGYYAQLGGTK